MRLVSIVTCAGSKDDLDLLEEELADLPSNRADAAVSVYTVLPYLAEVKRLELRTFMEDREKTTCPLASVRELAAGIWKRTQGRFVETVDWLEWAQGHDEEPKWESLARQLDSGEIPAEWLDRHSVALHPDFKRYET